MKFRHTKINPCPCCGGYTEMKRGIGQRCSGETNEGLTFCTREEYAGNCKDIGWAYIHVNRGECKCGKFHGDEVAAFGTSTNRTYKPSKEKAEAIARVSENLTAASTRYALKIWNEGMPIEGTDALSYINSRGANPDILLERDWLLQQLRYHPVVYHSETKQTCAALLMAIKDTEGVVCGVQAIYLDGWGKADIEPNKKSFGNLSGNSIYLSPPAETIGLTAGLENGLSVEHIDKIPTLAVTGDAFIPKVQIPGLVKKVLLYVDGDASGSKALVDAKKNFEDLGLEVEDKQAPYGKDWNDVLKEMIDDGTI